MGIFDSDKTEEFAIPVKKESETDVKQTEIRKLSGHSSISDVAKNAPSKDAGSYPSLDSPAVTRRLQAGASVKPTPSQSKAQKEAIELAAKEERKQQAIKTIGKRYSRAIAKLPYDAWAALAANKALSLSKTEEDELAEAYFELAQALNPDLTSPWMIGFGIVIQNAMLIGPRIAMLATEEKEEEPDEEEKEKAKP